jgi:hypothetical protein
MACPFCPSRSRQPATAPVPAKRTYRIRVNSATEADQVKARYPNHDIRTEVLGPNAAVLIITSR